MNDVTTKAGVRVPILVADPTLIKVRAIKRKYVEQMPHYGGISAAPIPQSDLQVVGATPASVVCRRGESGNLLKIHRMNWAEHLCRDITKADGEVDYGSRVQAALKEAHQQIDRYPQLFED